MIQNIAILGAGALGAAYATRFITNPKVSLCFIARGTRARHLQQDGVVVNGNTFHIPVANPEDNDKLADFIIVSLKHHQLQEALPYLDSFIGENTIILSVMNGLDSEKIIGARYGMEKILYAIAVGIDALRNDNKVTYTKIGKIFFGEAVNDTITRRVAAVQEALELAGIGYEIPVDMIRALWWKFMINVGTNQASAVTGQPYGAFQTNPQAQALMESLMVEVIALAKPAGVNLSRDDVEEWYPFLNTLSPQGKTSMLQDIEAQRKTEVDIFAGKVVDLGIQYGVPTPVNQTVLHIIQVIEASYKRL
jgi:2-dehydropantoate 2-reductase